MCFKMYIILKTCFNAQISFDNPNNGLVCNKGLICSTDKNPIYKSVNPEFFVMRKLSNRFLPSV